jgi:hypothetical protein
MTLSNASIAEMRLIVWCRGCGHRVEPDAAELARLYGALTTAIDWRRAALFPPREPKSEYGRQRNRARVTGNH